MITSVFVDGFKSLNNFTMELRPGLNILVGPNGSGKTNIVKFFEFLNVLQDNPLHKAIAASGGVGIIFSRIKDKIYKNEISVNIKGSIQIKKRSHIYYEYSFSIGQIEGKKFMVYRSQRIKLKYRTVYTSPGTNIKQKDFDLDIQISINEDGKKSIKFNSFNTKKIKFAYIMNIKKNINLKEKYKEFIHANIRDVDCIVGILRLLGDAYYIDLDLKGGTVFNIEPSKVRIPEDYNELPGIKSDGTGLYATLCAIKESEEQKDEPELFFMRKNYLNIVSIESTKLTRIMQFIKLANQAIRDINVSFSSIDNKISIIIEIDGENTVTKLPLSAMSDGVIKWMSLITLIFTNRTFFSIEEPENYIHPLLQGEIISIIRSVLSENNFVIFSTHSETILNSAKPEEIIVVEFEKGKTKALRLDNEKALSEEISRTGFGLGYYYIAGALTNE